MIITALTVGESEYEVTMVVKEPDPDWRYMRDDAMEVRWHNEGDHWHIPYLVRCFRVSAFNVDTSEHEFEEYWIDPIDNEEVKPEYVTKDITRKIPGHKEIECEVLLTEQERDWLTPEIGVVDKHSVISEYAGKRIELVGVWLQRCEQLSNNKYHGWLSIDRVIPAG